MDDENALQWAQALFQDVLHAWFEGEDLIVERGLKMRIIRVGNISLAQKFATQNLVKEL